MAAIKKVMIIICISLLTCMFTSCQQNYASLGECPVSMHTVTQDSEYEYITFTFDMPENWIAGADSSFSVGCYDEGLENTDSTIYEALPFMIHISHNAYYSIDLSIMTSSIYKELYNGNPEPFKENLIKSFQDQKATLDRFECKYYDGKKVLLLMLCTLIR